MYILQEACFDNYASIDIIEGLQSRFHVMDWATQVRSSEPHPLMKRRVWQWKTLIVKHCIAETYKEMEQSLRDICFDVSLNTEKATYEFRANESLVFGMNSRAQLSGGMYRPEAQKVMNEVAMEVIGKFAVQLQKPP